MEWARMGEMTGAPAMVLFCSIEHQNIQAIDGGVPHADNSKAAPPHLQRGPSF